MKPMHCLIVEDEPLAAGILEDYIQQVPFLQLVGKCPDALFAAEALQQNPVEVLFLDLNLPGLKGLDFLRTLRQPPQVILTTAYHEFALESYDLKVTDYLLKPIDFERFIKAVHKLKPALEPATPLANTRPFHFFNVSKKMVRVWIDDILMVESQKEYVRLHLAGGKQLTTKMTLGELEQILHPHHFLRIHRSFLVAVRHIEAYNNTSVQVEGVEVSLGRQYRDAVLERLNQI
jgi:DNA-binding LytR/AlgR family response regulator